MQEETRLRRRLGLTLLTLYGLGTTVGAGIYVLIGKVAGEAGYLAPVAFVGAAVLAGLSAFSFAELATRYPKSAGEAVYVAEGLRRPSLALVVGVLVIFAGAVSSATISLGFVGYFQELVSAPGWVVLAGLVISLIALAAWGIAESVTIAAAVTVVEVVGLLVVAAAAFRSGSGVENVWAGLQNASPAAIPGILGGIVLAFFAFIGFEDIVNVAEETRSPTRVLPRAIILTLVLTTALYLLVITAALGVMTPEALGQSTAPLAQVFAKATGLDPFAIGVVAAVAMLNGVLIQIIMASRMLYGLAQQGRIPGWIGAVNPRTGTPVRATIAIGISILLLAFAFPIVTLAESTSFIILLIFGVVNLSLLTIKWRGGTGDPAFCVPAWVPASGFLVCCGFAVLQLMRFSGVL